MFDILGPSVSMTQGNGERSYVESFVEANISNHQTKNQFNTAQSSVVLGSKVIDHHSQFVKFSVDFVMFLRVWNVNVDRILSVLLPTVAAHCE